MLVLSNDDRVEALSDRAGTLGDRVGVLDERAEAQAFAVTSTQGRVQVTGLRRLFRIRFPDAKVSIALFCLVLIAGLWAATVQRIVFERDEAIANKMKENANLVMVLEEQTLRTIKSAEQTALFVAHKYATRRPQLDGEKSVQDALADAGLLDATLFTSISVADEHGDVSLSTVSAGLSNSADREFFEFHRLHRGDQLVIGKPILGRRSGNWLIPLTRRIDKPDGSFGGVVVVTIDPAFFTRMYEKADLGEHGVVLLAGLDGIVRARQAGQRSSFGEDIRNGFFLELLAGKPAGSTVAASKLDGVRRIYAYRSLPEYSLFVAVGTAEVMALAEFEEHKRGHHLNAALASAFIVLFGAGLMLSLSRKRRAFDALARSEVKFRATFHQAAVGIVHAALSGRFLQANKTLCDMLGYSEQELLALDYRDITYPPDLPNSDKLVQQLTHADGPALLPQIEKRYVRKDGTVFWALISASLVRDAAGGPNYFVAMIQDIDAAKEEQERFRATFTQANIGIAHTTPDGRYIETNEMMSELLGYTHAELCAMRVSDIVHPDDLAQTLADRTKDVGAQRAAVREMRFIRKNHTIGWANRTISAVRDPTGAAKYFISIVQDITERKRAELALADSQEQFQQLVSHIPQAFWIAAADRDEAVYISPAFEGMFGRSFGSLQHAFAEVLGAVHPEDRERARGALRTMDATNRDLQLRILRPDGTLRWLRANGYPIRDAKGSIYRIAGTFEDITEHKALQDRVLHQANYDSLTQLPNRTLMLDRLDQAQAQHERGPEVFALLMIDIDRFKTINDSLGYQVGDAVLCEVGERIVSVLRGEDTVARPGGDEFIVILNEITQAIDVIGVAQKLMQAITSPMQVEDHTIHCTASIGIALSPRDGADPGTLLMNAEAAMYAAKDVGRNAFRFYAAELNATVTSRLELENALRGALDRGELELHYQAQFEMIPGGGICGFEALLRWNRPQCGLMSPLDFLPLAEETGLIVPIGEWVLRQACRQAKEWVMRFDPKLRVAVNVSPRQFSQPEFAQSIAAALKSTGLPAKNLELELTESMVMQDVERSIRTLSEVKAMGVSIALDDFGTGYSSLAYLRRFPIDILKIDKSFVSEVCGNPDDAALCASIIAMAHALRLTVVAEGVETENQFAFLIQQMCDRGQGYLYSRPLEAEAAGELLGSGRKLETPPALSGAQRTLLLLDDEENILSALKRLFRRDGYKILTATNATHAFELLAGNRVGVIIADQRMPNMSGTEFFSWVRPLYPDTVRIVLSGYTDLQSVINAINEGSIYRFLTKPWDDDLLRAEIREAFSQQELARENVARNRRFHKVPARSVESNPPATEPS